MLGIQSTVVSSAKPTSREHTRSYSGPVKANFTAWVYARLHPRGPSRHYKVQRKSEMALWWPRLSRQIEDLVKQCRKCTARRINKKQPMIPRVIPARPWQVISTDICYVKKCPYLIVVDYFLKFIEVNYLASLTSSETICVCKTWYTGGGALRQRPPVKLSRVCQV